MAAISSAPATSVLGFRRALPNRLEALHLQYFACLSPSRPVRRLADATGLQQKKFGVRKLPASGSNTPNSNTSKEGTSSSGSSGSDPPLLTNLAGLLVFLLVLLVVGSLFMWLVGLILHPPSR
ncbi:uncharacterized protein LOC110092039 [Dendrobium catenatum]|uniref:uncharacterized protein LOC110092039 n=1 Tax=Dendrobium catenatum TaxID=906689 RepID=UPI0009F74469|nr:uncharacterized protein LOC110092039 [Dendrobium catenatum]